MHSGIYWIEEKAGDRWSFSFKEHQYSVSGNCRVYYKRLYNKHEI